MYSLIRFNCCGCFSIFEYEKTIELTITFGTITSPVNIPARSLAETATITSGPVSLTATVNASMCPIKWEGKVELAELAKRYCMHCGAVMTMEAQGCPRLFQQVY